jgi:DNA polymerase-3 subunit epsilon
MRKLQLTRPLACIDLETTGANVHRDRIVEIAIVTLYPDGRRERYVQRVNPEIPIPAEATRVHGISNDDVRDAPRLAELAPQVVEMLRNVDIAGYNIARFDLPVLVREFARVGIRFETEERHVADAQVVFHRMEPRDLSAAVRKYCNRELEGAHGALADAEATLDVLLAQVDYYGSGERVIPDTVPGLGSFSDRRNENFVDADGRLLWDGDVVVVGFGKHKGTSIVDLQSSAPDYLQWILRKDFSDEVKNIVEQILAGKPPKR